MPYKGHINHCNNYIIPLIYLDTLIFKTIFDYKNISIYPLFIVAEDMPGEAIGGRTMKTELNMNSTKRISTWRRPMTLAMAAVFSLGLLSGCVTDQGNKQTMGTLLGAGLGGFAGSKIGGGKGQLAATAAGVLLGGVLGNSMGQSLDRADQAYAMRAQNQALEAPIGQTISWSNPDSGHSGQVTPTRAGRDTSTGAYCREYQTEVIVGGESQVGYGTACRMPDGDWKITS